MLENAILATKTLQLAKMAFVGAAENSTKTTQTQLFKTYEYRTLIAVYVHFNCFIDLTINPHTNPYSLASSKLL